jgi:hypothetical protein
MKKCRLGAPSIEKEPLSGKCESASIHELHVACVHMDSFARSCLTANWYKIVRWQKELSEQQMLSVVLAMVIRMTNDI